MLPSRLSGLPQVRTAEQMGKDVGEAYELLYKAAFEPKQRDPMTPDSKWSTSTLMFDPLHPIVKRMTTPLRVTDLELTAALASALGPAAANARYERSAIEVAPRLSQEAIRAIGRALAVVVGAPSIGRVSGLRDREDPSWLQLVLTVAAGADSGTQAWDDSLDACGRVLEYAIERNPDHAAVIADQITFDV